MDLKKLFLFALAIPFLGIAQSSNDQESTYLDTKGNKVNSQEFRAAWNNSARWDYIDKEGNRVNTLHDTVYLMFEIKYDEFREKLENLTNQEIPSNATILIEYVFANDLCSSITPNNSWTTARISKRKRFMNRHLKELKRDDNYFVVFLFQSEIKLDTNPNNDSEYFFSDRNNYLRNNYFIKPTLCGAFAALKPNGELLIRNGENRIDLFAQYLKDENWNKFFPEQEDR